MHKFPTAPMRIHACVPACLVCAGAAYDESMASKRKVVPRVLDVRPVKVYREPATKVKTL